MKLGDHISWNLTLYLNRAEIQAISQINPTKLSICEEFHSWKFMGLEEQSQRVEY